MNAPLSASSSAAHAAHAAHAQTAQRTIIHRTKGRKHGPITRLVSPGDVGGLIKPFIFLDYFDFSAGPVGGFGWHPHSGLATLTVLLSGSSSYADSSGKAGELHAGSLEWMRAGGGVWHTSSPIGDAPLRGFQLWVALPPDLEHTEAFSQYIEPENVERDGPVTVVLGQHGAARSAIEAPSSMQYFNVALASGQRWEYTPPPGHTVAWAFPHKGRLHVAGEVIQEELAVFNASEGGLIFEAEGDTAFMLGSAVPHPHELHMGHYSVHTNAHSLDIGEAEIRRLGRERKVAV